MRSLIKFPITILELGGSKDYVHLRYQINLGVGEYLRSKLNLNTVYLLSETEGPEEKIFWLEVMSYGAGPSAAI